MKQDLQIFDLIKKERERQSSGLELIASENYVSDQVLEAFGVVPDYDLSIMKDKQTLFDITTNILVRIREVLEEVIGVDIGEIMEIIIIIRANNKKINSIIMGMEIMEET